MKPLFSPPSQLSHFQQNFGVYLRTQDNKPFGNTPKRVSGVYQELVFNNVKGFLDKCFPICQSIIGPTLWLDLCKRFFKEQALHSPYFVEINQSFVDFLYQQDLATYNLPLFFAELAHYEWVELYVDVHTGELSTQQQQQPQGTLLLHPTVQNLHYQWPVHRIDATHLPEQPQETFLLVFRHSENNVSFLEMGVLSYALLEFLQDTPCKETSELVTLFLDSIQQSGNQELRQATENTLQDLLQQSILIYR